MTYYIIQNNRRKHNHICLAMGTTDMTDTNKNTLALRLGRNLMRARKALSLTQEQVASALSVEPETISRFERGTTTPSLGTLERLAEILGTLVGDLLQEGEPRAFSETERLAALLDPLADNDRAFALESLERLCGHLLERERQARGKRG